MKSIPPLDECSIEFVPIQNEKIRSRIWYRISRFFRFFILSLQNTYILIRHGDLNRPLTRSRCPMRWIWEFPSLVYTAKMTSSSQMIKAILKHPRKDPQGGFFNDVITSDMFLPLLKDLFGVDEANANDFLFQLIKTL